MHWSDLWAAFALYLVLEGLMPFLNPGAHEADAAAALRNSTSARLRMAGLASMVAGALLLYFVRGAG